jgi:hypothetical protein
MAMKAAKQSILHDHIPHLNLARVKKLLGTDAKRLLADASEKPSPDERGPSLATRHFRYV